MPVSDTEKSSSLTTVETTSNITVDNTKQIEMLIKNQETIIQNLQFQSHLQFFSIVILLSIIIVYVFYKTVKSFI